MEEKINWWWYLLIAACIIPLLYYLIAGAIYEFPSLRSLAITGLNPMAGLVLNFVGALAITVAFKTLGQLVIRKIYARVCWVVAGIVVVVFILSVPVKHLETIQLPRRYYSVSGDFPVQHRTINYYLAATAIELLAFLFFFIRNFPKGNDH
ncbi:MAG: hypothetical protein C5B52_08745 [Bacteroidetes bacterium]|nr:MAG: hypothetical protein C5B52_08745 [Bacteroidota bacterium]